jgi:cytidylate kinase
MNALSGLEKCQSFINCQLRPGGLGRSGAETISHFTAITISRQTGSGGHTLADRLAHDLQAQESDPLPAWTVFDRNLVEQVLIDHNLPGRLARFMPEDHISGIGDTMDELFGLHPPSWILVRKTSETILRLAQMGHVILIGRGSNVITHKLPNVFHVRLVGGLPNRVKRLQALNQLSAKEALRFARREDLARRRYLKQFFDKDIEDPLLYHMVINTDIITADEAVRMIESVLAPQSRALAA